MRFKIFYLLLMLAPLLPLRAEERFSGADALFDEGKFEEARGKYREHLTEPGLPAAFYYNIGTAAFRAGALGEAHVMLWRASFAAPLDQDTRVNLRLVRSKLSSTALATRPANWITWWPDFLRIVPWTAWLSVSLLLLAIFLWGTKQAWPAGRWSVLGSAIFLGLVTALAARQSWPPPAGILADAKVYSGPGKTYPEITSVVSGSLVSLEEAREDWLKIRYLDSRLQETVGWVEKPTALKLDGGN